MKPRILIVADHAPQRARLARWLMGAGYLVELADGAKRAREVIASEDLALAIVAGRLGRADPGLVAELRSQVKQHILLEEPEDATGGQAGAPIEAPGGLLKPLTEQELLALVKAALPVESSSEMEAGPQCLRFEGYTLDIGGRICLDAPGRELPLTRAEFSLLLAFARMPGRVLSRDELRRAVAGRAVEPDDRSIDMMISRLRRKIEPDPKAARIIITVPGNGYKFTPKPLADFSPAEMSPAPSHGVDSPPGPTETNAQETNVQQTTLHAERTPASLRARGRPMRGFRPALIGSAVISLASIAGLVALWFPGYATRGVPVPATSAPRFDPAVVPLVSDAVRTELEGYSARPNFKALAISADGWGVAFGAADPEGAQREALDRCKARTRLVAACRIYASGADVMWSKDALHLPLSADIHAEPLDARLVVAELPMLTDGNRRRISESYVQDRRHKALAIKRGGYLWHGANSAGEAARMTVERCSDFEQVPCLLVSVDGLLTVQIPKSRRVVDLFMLATETGMSEEDKRRVGLVYGQKEWRALARGKRGGWYPVAEASSEFDAIERALGSCAQQENECRLHAVSNFRVADE